MHTCKSYFFCLQNFIKEKNVKDIFFEEFSDKHESIINLKHPNVVNKATNINHIDFDPDMHHDNATESVREIKFQ